MPWARFEDTYPEHPKIEAVGAPGLALHVRMVCYCARNLTDGFVPEAAALRMAADLPPGTLTQACDIRVDGCTSGLLTRVAGGYRVHDYLAYNPSRAHVLESRAKGHEQKVSAGRKRASGARRAGGRFTSSDASDAPARALARPLARPLAVATSPDPNPSRSVPDPDGVSSSSSARTHAGHSPDEVSDAPDPWFHFACHHRHSMRRGRKGPRTCTVCDCTRRGPFAETDDDPESPTYIPDSIPETPCPSCGAVTAWKGRRRWCRACGMSSDGLPTCRACDSPMPDCRCHLDSESEAAHRQHTLPASG